MNMNVMGMTSIRPQLYVHTNSKVQQKGEREEWSKASMIHQNPALHVSRQTPAAAEVEAGARSPHYQSQWPMKLQTSFPPLWRWLRRGFGSLVRSSPGRSAPSVPPRLSSQWGHSPADGPSPWRAPASVPTPSAGPAFCGLDWEWCCWGRWRRLQWLVASGGTPGLTCRGQTPLCSGSETERPASQWRPQHSTAVEEEN